MVHKVFWSKKVLKRLDFVPSHIRDKFFAWVLLVTEVGLRRARQYQGFHDEPLKGARCGQ